MRGNDHSKNNNGDEHDSHKQNAYASPPAEKHIVTFQNGTITQIDGSTIKLTKSEVMRDSKGKPIFAILFDYKNNGKKSKILQKAYLESISANQKLGNVTKNLVTTTPSDKLKYQKQAAHLQEKIKPKNTVSGVYYYQIIDKDKPVNLVIHNSHMKQIAKKEYQIK